MEERAQKIYDLFSAIGVDKIKRIQSFTAVTLSSISRPNFHFRNIQHIWGHVTLWYRITIYAENFNVQIFQREVSIKFIHRC